jgi:hypothetical protein
MSRDMDKYRIALSGDFRKADGSFTFPSFDLSPLTDNPRIEVVWVDPVDGAMPAEPLAGCHGLILLVPRFTAASIPPDNTLALSPALASAMTASTSRPAPTTPFRSSSRPTGCAGPSRFRSSPSCSPCRRSS